MQQLQRKEEVVEVANHRMTKKLMMKEKLVVVDFLADSEILKIIKINLNQIIMCQNLT